MRDSGRKSTSKRNSMRNQKEKKTYTYTYSKHFDTFTFSTIFRSNIDQKIAFLNYLILLFKACQ